MTPSQRLSRRKPWPSGTGGTCSSTRSASRPGSVWWTKREAEPGLIDAARSGGALWPTSTPVLKAIWAAVSVSDPDGEVQKVKGAPLPDPELRDYENVPLDEDVNAYFAREVLPHVPDAWIDHDKTKIGYEIPFTRHFYVYTPPRPASRDRRGTARA